MTSKPSALRGEKQRGIGHNEITVVKMLKPMKIFCCAGLKLESGAGGWAFCGDHLGFDAYLSLVGAPIFGVNDETEKLRSHFYFIHAPGYERLPAGDG